MGTEYANAMDLKRALYERKLDSSKRDNGRVMVIGGSEDFHGAPALAGNAAYALLAALRTGAGYATAFVPKSVLVPARCVAPDVIVRPLRGNNLTASDAQMISGRMKDYDSIVVGPGLGRTEGVPAATAIIIKSATANGVRTVVDADAIRAIPGRLRRLGRNVIVTPQDREFSALYGKAIGNMDWKHRIDAAVKAASEFGCSVLLKGHRTIITDGKRVKIVRPRSAALATMGTGDVLSGIIGGIAANHDDMFDAAVAGAYLHALIGDLLHDRIGDRIIPSDIVDEIPHSIMKFVRAR